MDSIYKVIELIGTSPNSWEEAAKNTIDKASQTLKDLRIAEAVEFDMKLEDGKVALYRTKVKLSFRYKD
jgi:flavin-binding protein dodecin